MSRSRLFVSVLKKSFPSRFILARLTRVPGFRGLIDKMLFDGDHLIYLPKDNVVNMNVEIEPPESMVLPSQVVEHFIQKARYHWIMNFCICRESMKCQDYPRDLGCLFLGEAVLNINPAFGRRVSKEEALEHVRRCREAGLVHLIGRNKLDTVWLGTGPGEKLLTICNCCPCCCLWLVLPTLHESIGSKVKRMPGVEVRVGEGCTGCGKCTEVCFVNAITLEDGKAVIGDACRGCGRCAEACPVNAITVSFEPESVERVIETVDSLVDVE